jgi:MYXO-CTERM domain-containing protein
MRSRAIRSKLGMFFAVGAPILSVSCALAAQARANGRMASANELVVSPVDPTFLAVETTVGLFFSHDTGATLGWICEAAVGYGDGGNQDPSLVLTPTQILAGTYEGVSVSADRGCSWKFTSTDRIVDLVARRDNPHLALALSSAYSGVSDAGNNLYLTRILQTQDDGNTWTQQGAWIDSTVVVETIDVAPSDVSRIYVGGAGWRTAADGGLERVGVVLASTNGGATFARTDIPFASSTQQRYASAYVSAVDPNDPNRLYVRIDDTLVDQLLVSDDGAMTFATAYQATGPLLGFALSADGTKVFIGGPFDGVRLARATTDSGTSLSFSQQSTTAVSCLTSVGDTLYACIRVPGTTALQHVGVSTDDGVTFAARSYFGCFSPLACPGSTVAAQCNPNLSLVHGTLGQCPEGGVDSDASSNGADAGSDATSPQGAADAGKAPPSARGGCSCEAEQTASAMGGVAASVLFVAIALSRRRSA